MFLLLARPATGGWFVWLLGPVPGTVNLSYAFGTNIFKYFVFNNGSSIQAAATRTTQPTSWCDRKSKIESRVAEHQR